MIFPLVLDLAKRDAPVRVPVVVTRRVLGFSTQAFYKWKKNPCSQRDWNDAHLINAALDINHDDPAFGYRFISDELGLSRKAGPPVHEDLIQRNFTTDRPNALWLTDIAEHQTDQGKIYLCAIKDIYSIDSRMKTSRPLLQYVTRSLCARQ